MIHRFSQEGTENIRISPSNIDFRSDVEQRNPLIQIHDAQSNDHGLTGSLANELINISGAEVFVYPRTDNSSYDDVWEEDPDPTYGSGRRMKAYFVPQPIAAQLTQWGIDVENKTTVVFSKEQVYKEFGDRMIRIGDIIELPYNASGVRLDKYRVTNMFDTGNFKFNWLYWSCNVENITDDITLDVDHK